MHNVYLPRPKELAGMFAIFGILNEHSVFFVRAFYYEIIRIKAGSSSFY
jgi:hypothetical protein